MFPQLFAIFKFLFLFLSSQNKCHVSQWLTGGRDSLCALGIGQRALPRALHWRRFQAIQFHDNAHSIGDVDKRFNSMTTRTVSRIPLATLPGDSIP
jgi:hypothetical protein